MRFKSNKRLSCKIMIKLSKKFHFLKLNKQRLKLIRNYKRLNNRIKWKLKILFKKIKLMSNYKNLSKFRIQELMKSQISSNWIIRLGWIFKCLLTYFNKEKSLMIYSKNNLNPKLKKWNNKIKENCRKEKFQVWVQKIK